MRVRTPATEAAIPCFHSRSIITVNSWRCRSSMASSSRRNWAALRGSPNCTPSSGVVAEIDSDAAHFGEVTVEFLGYGVGGVAAADDFRDV
jgi:hypothetical protein